MNSARLPILILALVWGSFAAYVALTAPQLPERVATHFGASGAPNGWMTRAGHVQFTILAGLAVPAFVLAIFAIMGRADDRWLNLPHKAHWLAPERRAATHAFIRRQGFWFAGLFIAFLAGIHHSVLAANARSPVNLPGAEVGWISGAFTAAVVVWAAMFYVRFFRRSA